MSTHFREARRAVAIKVAHDQLVQEQVVQEQVAEPAEPEPRPHSTLKVGWWPRSISDGDAHFGDRRSDGIVVALCGVMFVPQVNPYLHKAVRQHSPADPEHACPACRKLHPTDR